MVGLSSLMLSIRSRMSLRGQGEPSRSASRLCFVLFLTTGMQTACAAAKESRAQNSATSVRFDIHDQPLSVAIERFSVVSGWQVIYDSSLASGRRSAHLHGSLPPAAALRIMLAGTGLKAEFMAADGAVLTVGSQIAIPPSERPSPPVQLRSYYGQIQATLMRAFCGDERLRGSAHRIALGIWIGKAGEVARAETLGTTGSYDIDAAFESDLKTIAFQPPPSDFEQPVVIVVTPDLLAQCRVVSTESAVR